MEISLFLAKVLGLYLVLVSIAILLRPKRFQDMIRDILGSPAVQSLGGIIALLIGILLVVSHNLWVADWRVLITLFAWAGLIKGILYLYTPELIPKLTAKFQKTPNLYIIGVIDLLIGLFLLYKGYINQM